MQQQHKPMEIMIVDDTPANLRLLSKILDRTEYEVRALPSGELAISSASLEPPDLILLDVRMPGLSGYEVCSRLKQQPETEAIPVIFISALHETEDKVRAFSVGGVDYITKPFQQAEVLARVNTHLELARMRAELVSARVRAESANLAKSAFLANMSHELRTPLNAVLGYAQLLEREEGLEPRVRNAVKVIHQGGDYLLTLINEVLDLAKIDAGHLEIHPAPFQPADFFPDIVAMFQIRASQNGIEFSYRESSQLPFSLIGDDKRLRQVVMNLLGNAIKFTPEGRVELEVEYADGVLSISVIDSGIGIPEAQLEKIFQPFSQTGEQKYKLQGTGLGLAISRNLSELMGGRILVQSELGQGSCFRVEIPMQVVDALPHEPSSTPVPMHIHGYQRSDGQEAPFVLLVADNHASSRQMLVDLLTPLGFQVESFASAEEVLKRLEKGAADLLITELALPGDNGLELCQQLLAKPGLGGFPILVLSGSSFESDRQASLNAGALAHIDKPLKQQALFDALAKALPLEWTQDVAEQTQQASATIEPLPALWHARLSELSNQGKLTQLVEQIQHYLLERPDHPLLISLDEAARNFDIVTVKAQLAESGTTAEER